MSGLLPTAFCPHVKTEWFIAGTQPVRQDTFYKQLDSGALVLDLPLEAQAWARKQGLPLLTDQTGSTGSLTLTSPVNNTTYRITPDLDVLSQQLLVSALADSNMARITFFVDGIAITTLPAPPYQTWWKLSTGEHRFWVEGLMANGDLIKSNVATITVVE